MAVSTSSPPRISKRLMDALPVEGKRILARVDYNVPLDEAGVITDDTRIRETLPTLESLLKRGASLLLCAHLGRPKGKVNPALSLQPVAKRLETLLHRPVRMAPDCVGQAAQQMSKELKPGGILLLENLRFHPQEEANDPAFSKALAGLADGFVQDAFGAVHRAHASTAGVPQYLPSAAGWLLAKEIFYLSKATENPERPLMAILGGAKVSDKIDVISALLEKVNALAIGGAMAYTFLKAQGREIGNSRVEADKLEAAKTLLKKSQDCHVQLFLPLDHVIAERVAPKTPSKTTPDVNIPPGWIGVDIGPLTVKSFTQLLANARTVIWNGPMGIFEMPGFDAGTLAIAQILAEITRRGAVTLVGGGDSVAAVQQAHLADQFSHLSTGGGASLEFLEGKTLPGIAALPDA